MRTEVAARVGRRFAQPASCAVLSALIVIVVPLSAAPKIRFEPAAVIAEKVTPGANTVWLAVAHEPQAYHMRVREYARMIADDDRDGVVRLDVSGGVSSESVWVVVDMASGDWITAEPGGGKIRVGPLTPPRVERRGHGKRAALAQDDAHLKFWVIRPGRGAWVQTSIDGELADDDGTPDGSVTAALDAFIPVADSPAAPDDFQRGDVLIAVDPFKLRLFELRVHE